MPDVNAAPWRISDATPPAQRLSQLADLAAQGAVNPRVREWAQLRAGNGTVAERAARLLVAVQRRGFRPDPDGAEYYQGVGYTLTHGGDCEDLSVLLMAALTAVGIKSKLRWLSQPGSALNHVTLAVQLPTGPAWAETTIPGARLGEDPYEAAQRLGSLERIRGRKEYKAAGAVRPSGAVQQAYTCPARGRGWCMQIWRPNDRPNTGWAQWVRYDLAQAWLARAVALTTAAEEARLDAAGWTAQQDATIQAWQALGYFYQSLNLPPTSDPTYIKAVTDAYGTAVGDNYLGKPPLPPNFQAHPAVTVVAGAKRSHTARYLAPDLATLDQQGAQNFGWIVYPTLRTMRDVQPDRFDAYTMLRVLLDANGAPSFGCVAVDSAVGAPCWFEYQTPAGPVTWNTLLWKADASNIYRYKHWIAPPLRASFVLARNLAAQLKAAGSPLANVKRVRNYVLVANAKTLSDFQARHPDQAVMSQQQALDLASSSSDAVGRLGRGEVGDAVFSGLYGVAAVLPAPANAIVGLAVGLADLLTRISSLPGVEFVGTIDIFGRPSPFFLNGSISGEAPNEPPLQEVPAPEGSALPEAGGGGSQDSEQDPAEQDAGDDGSQGGAKGGASKDSASASSYAPYMIAGAVVLLVGAALAVAEA